MWYTTELMEMILTSEKGQELVDMVSDIYGESYTGLWFFQMYGILLDQIDETLQSLEEEIFPSTSTLLLSYWEKEYGIVPDESKTTDERRKYLVTKMRSYAPVTPYKLQQIIEAYTDRGSTITENVDDQSVQIDIIGYVEDLSSLEYVLSRVMPAHIRYTINNADRETAEFVNNAGIYVSTETAVRAVFK